MYGFEAGITGQVWNAVIKAEADSGLEVTNVYNEQRCGILLYHLLTLDSDNHCFIHDLMTLIVIDEEHYLGRQKN